MDRLESYLVTMRGSSDRPESYLATLQGSSLTAALAATSAPLGPGLDWGSEPDLDLDLDLNDLARAARKLCGARERFGATDHGYDPVEFDPLDRTREAETLPQSEAEDDSVDTDPDDRLSDEDLEDALDDMELGHEDRREARAAFVQGVMDRELIEATREVERDRVLEDEAADDEAELSEEDELEAAYLDEAERSERALLAELSGTDAGGGAPEADPSWDPMDLIDEILGSDEPPAAKRARKEESGPPSPAEVESRLEALERESERREDLVRAVHAAATVLKELSGEDVSHALAWCGAAKESLAALGDPVAGDWAAKEREAGEFLAGLRARADAVSHGRPQLKRKRDEMEAAQEIRREQRREGEPIVPGDHFAGLVYEITHEAGIGPTLRDRAFADDALAALRVAGEDFLIELLRRSQRLAGHAGRDIIVPADVQLALSLSSRRF